MNTLISVLATFAILQAAFLAHPVASTLYTPKDFKSGYFKFNDKSSGFYQVQINAPGADTENGNIFMAFGDFNGDSFTDYVSVSTDRSTVYVYIWDRGNANFVQGFSHTISKASQTAQIVNIMPVVLDQSKSAGLGFLLVFQDSDNLQQTLYAFTPAQACTADQTMCEFDSAIVDLEGGLDYATQPFLGNFQIFESTHTNALVYFDGSQRRVAYLNGQTVQKTVDFQSLLSKGQNCNYNLATTLSGQTFSTPHYNSVTDLDGDCKADLIITSTDGTDTYLEIYFYTDDGYCLISADKISNQYDGQALSLAGLATQDIDFDGATDIIVVYNSSTQTYQQILTNKLRVDPNNLCIGGNPQFENVTVLTNTQAYNYFGVLQDAVPLQIRANVSEGSTALTPFYSFVRFGDLNLDGYPELILTLARAGSAYGNVYIFQNVANPSFPHTRYFELNTDSTYGLVTQQQTIQAALFDINENGMIDFLFNYVDSNGQIQISSVYNYLKVDMYFIKCLGLSGQCDNEDCQSSIFYGATFECKVSISDQEFAVGKGNQLQQSAFGALQLPFSIIGLSRTNNYIETLTIGMPISDSPSIKQWPTTIPNSQLIFYPYTDNTDNWQIYVFVKPTEAVVIVVIVTSVILIILGVAIACLHKKEKEEDQKDQNNFVHLFR